MKKPSGWKLAIAAAAVLVACSSGGSSGGGGDGSDGTPLTWTHPWPMFHGFETHLGFNNAQGPQSAEFNTFSASTDVGNPPNSVAVAQDGTIYLPNSRGKLSAIDPAAHAAKWAYDTGDGQGIPTFPVVDSQGTVYFGSMNKNIYAVDKNGNNLFAPFATGDKLAEAAPALVNGKLFISSDDGKLYLSK